MALQFPLQLYSGLLKNIHGATASVPGIIAWTKDSQQLFVSNGSATYVRSSPGNQVWVLPHSSPPIGKAALRQLAQAAGGNALLGDFILDTVGGITYILTAYANRMWTANAIYELGDSVFDSNGNLQTVAVAGESGATEPTWSTESTTIDNTVTWQESAGFVTIASEGSVGTVSSVNNISPVDGNITLNLSNLNDVYFTSPPTTGEVLSYNGTYWINAPLTVATTLAPGIVQPDGTTITISGGVISAISGNLSGSGTTGFLPVWTGTAVLGNSHIDDGVSVAGAVTTSEPLIGTKGGWFTNTLGSQIQTQFPFSQLNSSVVSADLNGAFVGVVATATTSPTSFWAVGGFASQTDGTPSGTQVAFLSENSNFNEVPYQIGDGQLYIQPNTNPDYPSANGFIGIANTTPACQLDVGGDIGINGNIVIPQAATGYHGTAGVKVQLSDGTGTSGHFAAFAADGSLTDGGTGGGAVTSVAVAVPSWQTVTGSPVTTSGTITISDNTQSPNLIFASPVSGSAAAPTFRSLVAADLPLATSLAFGAVKPDGSTITISGGVISAVGSGTVTSVALTVPSWQTVTGSPISTNGTLAVTDNTQNANIVFAGPSSGSAAAPTFRTLVTADLPSGVGTVTSVALSAPAEFTVSGSPVTTTGTLTFTKATQTANTVWAGPTSGSAAVPTFRSLAPADLPVATSSALGAVKPDGTIITVSAGAITVPEISASVFGVAKVDGTTITASAGVITAVASGAPAPLFGTTNPTGVGTPAFVQSASGTGNFGTTAAFGSNVTAGHLIIAVGTGDTTGGTSIGDTLGTSFTQIEHTTTNQSVYVWFGIAPSSGANTVTLTNVGIARSNSLIIYEFSGVAAVVDNTGSTSTGSSTVTVSNTPTSANDLLLSVLVDSNSVTSASTVSSPWTAIGAAHNNNGDLNAAYQLASVIAPYSATWTVAVSSFAYIVSIAANATPVSGVQGQVYYQTSTDPYIPFVYNSGVWKQANVPIATTSSLGSVQPDGVTIDITPTGVISVPIATSSVLGLVKPDGTIITDSSGAITVPKASASVFGVVEVDGTTITSASGVISASGGLSNPMTTVGDMIVGGTSGTPTRLAAGTSGYVLQTNGSGSAPTWVAAGGSGSSYPPPTTLTASASSELDFTSIISSTYSDYEIRIRDLVPSSASADILIQLSTNNGSSWITTGYSWGRMYVGVSQTLSIGGSNTSSTGFTVVGGAGSSLASISGRGTLFNLDSVEIIKSLLFDSLILNTSTTGTNLQSFGGSLPTTSAINAIRIIPTTGTLTSGSVTLQPLLSSGGGGAGSAASLPPYLQIGTSLYIPADGMFAANLPPSSPSWINSVTPSSVVAQTNGDLIITTAATSTDYFLKLSGGATSVEAVMSAFYLASSDENGNIGAWIYDSTNSKIWNIGCVAPVSASNAAQFNISSYTYNGSGSPSFVSGTIVAVGPNGWGSPLHLRIVTSAGTASFQISLNGGSSYTTITTESVGTISDGGIHIYDSGSHQVTNLLSLKVV